MELFRFKNLSEFNDLEHFVSTRKGGFSKPPFEFNNMSLECNDIHTIINRKELSEILNLPLENFVYQYQTHTKNVIIINQSHKGRGTTDINDALQDNDAMITSEKQICIVAMAADCVPVLLFDSENKIVAAIHSGWKGTIQEITKTTVQKMIDEFNSKPENIFAGIGPSIGKCCYEIGNEVAEKIKSKLEYSDKVLFFNNKTQKFHFDLWLANKLQLEKIGINTKNIEIAEICTKCNQDFYYSARNNDLGRFSAGIFLK